MRVKVGTTVVAGFPYNAGYECVPTFLADEIKQTEPSEVLPPEGEKAEESPFTFLEYLDSDRGHEIAKKVLELWKDLQQTTLGSKSEETKEQLRRQHEAGVLASRCRRLLEPL